MPDMKGLSAGREWAKSILILASGRISYRRSDTLLIVKTTMNPRRALMAI